MDSVLSYIPYCGAAPLPAEIWTRWNFDGLLIAALAAGVVLHAARLRTSHGARGESQRRTALIAGWTALALALVSPLCALSVALFSARVTQHMWIAMIAAPLLAFASGPVRRMGAWATPMRAAGVFAIALWAWHLPNLYDATFRSDAAYWLMHLSIGLTAVLVWRALLRGSREELFARLGAAFLTLMQMGLLGALITFAPRTLYQSHLVSSSAWGLTALEDQQLGGLIMWVPASVSMLLGALWVLYRLLTPAREVQA